MTIVIWSLIVVQLATIVWHTRESIRYRKARHELGSTARDRDDPNNATNITITSAGRITHTSIRTGTAAGAGTPAGVTESVADIPILAYKRARLIWQPGGVFRLLSSFGPVLPDDNARCLTHPFGAAFRVRTTEPHDAPDLACMCGFHAKRDPDQLDRNFGIILLDVELSGRVIVHEQGYRAQHQRVLRAHTPPCYYCGAPPTVVALIHHDPALTTAGTFAGTFLPTLSNGYETRALCADHKHTTSADVELPIHRVMHQLGVPVDNPSDDMRQEP